MKSIPVFCKAFLRNTRQCLCQAVPAVRLMQKEVRSQSDPVLKKGAEIAKNIHLAKYNQNMRGKGDVEGLLTLLGRY